MNQKRSSFDSSWTRVCKPARWSRSRSCCAGPGSLKVATGTAFILTRLPTFLAKASFRGEPGWSCRGRSEQGGLRSLQNLAGHLPRHGRKALQELLQRIVSFEVFEKRLHRNPRALENRSAAGSKRPTSAYAAARARSAEASRLAVIRTARSASATASAP